MPDTNTTRYVYACGCTVSPEGDWTLCPDCSARIGTYGTCLQCGGPADEQWAHPWLPGETYCSRACAGKAAYDALT